MTYLLAYDGYMREEKIQEICPSAKLFMQCSLRDCTLGFHRSYETAMPTLEQGEEIVLIVIQELEESDLENTEAIYPDETYQKANWNLKTEKGVSDVMVFLMRETLFAFPKEKEVKAMEEAYEEHSFDYNSVENTLDGTKDREEAYGTLYPGTDRQGKPDKPGGAPSARRRAPQENWK